MSAIIKTEPDARTRVALVTGGSGGIGRAVVERLAKDGIAVGVHYSGNKAKADDTVAAIVAAGGKAISVGGDVADEEAMSAAFEANENETSPAHRKRIAMEYLRNEPIQRRSRAMVSRIEDAARIVLAETGRDRMTTGQVARQAGIAIGSLYRYFPDRVAILDRIWPDRRDNKPGDSEDPPAPSDGATHDV